ncbi:hypothetical protein AB685_15350 [Bacillus sp. LL01]|nr:hypothetical protein AB685_15350 [Bacillus sp. LL01]
MRPFIKSLLNAVVDFRKRLRFPRGDLEPFRALLFIKIANSYFTIRQGMKEIDQWKGHRFVPYSLDSNKMRFFKTYLGIDNFLRKEPRNIIIQWR